MTPINGTFGYDFCLTRNVMLEKASVLEGVLKAERQLPSIPKSSLPGIIIARTKSSQLTIVELVKFLQVLGTEL